MTNGPLLGEDGSSAGGQPLHGGIQHCDRVGQVPGYPLDWRHCRSFQSVQDTCEKKEWVLRLGCERRDTCVRIITVRKYLKPRMSWGCEKDKAKRERVCLREKSHSETDRETDRQADIAIGKRAKSLM